MNWLRRRVNHFVLADLKRQRNFLAQFGLKTEDGHLHPHTHGMIDGLERAIDALGGPR